MQNSEISSQFIQRLSIDIRDRVRFIMAEHKDPRQYSEVEFGHMLHPGIEH